jgi:GTP cyclohydrolase II
MTNSPQIAYAPLNTVYGDFKLYVFSWSQNEQDNILVLERKTASHLPLVRIQSACYTGEIFGSTDCDCHWQLETALKRIHSRGGYFIYMLQDGRGAGLLTKIRGMHMTAVDGIDTADAYAAQGVSADPRDYDRPAWILKYFKIDSLELLTNNPRKIKGLTENGIKVRRVEHESVPTERNRDYLSAKKSKLGHLFKNV